MSEIGDLTVKILADTDGLDNAVNDLLDRMQRTIEAARTAWNAGKEDASKVECVGPVAATLTKI